MKTLLSFGIKVFLAFLAPSVGVSTSISNSYIEQALLSTNAIDCSQVRTESKTDIPSRVFLGIPIAPFIIILDQPNQMISSDYFRPEQLIMNVFDQKPTVFRCCPFLQHHL